MAVCSLYCFQVPLLTITDWGDDPFSINEHFGTEDDLKSLSSALHKRDMSLMVDVVINHLAANQTNNTIDYELFPSPFNTESAFHPPCTIDFGNQTSIEHCWTVANAPPVLADLNSEDSTVMDAMIKSVVSLGDAYDIDGIRLDTARNVPKTHLTEFQNAVGVFVTGEALNQSSVYCRQYQGPLDSVINYPLWYVLGDTFMGRTTFDYLSAEMASEVAMFPDANVWTNFLDNHDQQRFASRDGDDVVRDANAVTFLMFNTGIPVVYYGFEQRFNGSGDPYNREPFWTSGYNTSATLYQHIATLHKVRATAYNLSSKAEYFGTTATVLATSAQYMAFERGPLVVVVSNVGVVGTDEQLAITESQFAEGDVITDLLGTSSVTVGSNGSFNSTAPEGQPRVSHSLLLK
jgi:alpha-amylase